MLILLLLAQGALAVLPKIENVYIGQFVNIPIPNGASVTEITDEPLPPWLMKNENFLQGVPRVGDTGKTFVKISDSGHDSVIEFNVLDDEQNPCGDKPSMWLEILYEEDTGFHLLERIENLLEVKGVLEADTSTTVKWEDIRLYENKYSKETREVEYISEGDGDYTYAITIKAGCGSDVDIVTDVLDIILGAELDTLGESITKGRILSRKERGKPEDVLSNLQFSTNAPEEMNEEVFTTTTVRSTTRRSVSTTTSQRTTRKVDNVPVKLNSLPTMHCVRGIYCEMPIPAKTFVDAEDGDTDKLKLEIKSISGGDEWVQVHKMKIRTVPMKEGEFEMRLEARDKAYQLASAPFTVKVSPSPPTAHSFHFEMEKPSASKFEKSPQLLIDFVHYLSSAFKTPTESVIVNKVEDAAGNRGFSLVHWSNATLSSKSCPKESLDYMKTVMIRKKTSIPKVDFMRAMTSEFIIKSVGLNLTGACVESTNVESTAPSVESGRESGFGWLALAAALALLMLLIAIALLCCLLRKPKKEKPSEFVSKGLPVVFPEEVGEDCEAAHAATPMLVKEERPPLKVSQHENPLYKPPPPIAAASPRGTTPGLAGTPAQQRLPPPYVPP